MYYSLVIDLSLSVFFWKIVKKIDSLFGRISLREVFTNHKWLSTIAVTLYYCLLLLQCGLLIITNFSAHLCSIRT